MHDHLHFQSTQHIRDCLMIRKQQL